MYVLYNLSICMVILLFFTAMSCSLVCEDSANVKILANKSNNINFTGTCYKSEFCMRVEVKGKAVLTLEEKQIGHVEGTVAGCSRKSLWAINCTHIGTECKSLKELVIGTDGQKISGNINVCCCKSDYCNTGNVTNKQGYQADQVWISPNIRAWVSTNITNKMTKSTKFLCYRKYYLSTKSPDWGLVKFDVGKTCLSEKEWCVNVMIKGKAVVERDNTLIEIKGGFDGCYQPNNQEAICDRLGNGCHQTKTLLIPGGNISGNMEVCCCNEPYCNLRKNERKLTCRHKADLLLSTINGTEKVIFDNDCYGSEYCVSLSINQQVMIRSPGVFAEHSVQLLEGSFQSCHMQAPWYMDCSVIGIGCYQYDHIDIGNHGQHLNGNMTICCCNSGNFCNDYSESESNEKSESEESDDESESEEEYQSTPETATTEESMPEPIPEYEPRPESTSEPMPELESTLESMSEPAPNHNHESENADAIYCYRNYGLRHRFQNGTWQKMIVNSGNDECKSHDNWCVFVEIKGNGTQIKSKNSIRFELDGTFHSCSHSVGMEPVVECSEIGNECKNVSELQIGSEGQMVYGNITVCCCNYQLCNKPYFTQSTQTATQSSAVSKPKSELHCLDCMSEIYSRMWNILKLNAIYKLPSNFTDACNYENQSHLIETQPCQTFCLTLALSDVHQDQIIQRYVRGCYDSLFQPGIVHQINNSNSCDQYNFKDLFKLVKTKSERLMDMCTCDQNMCNTHTIAMPTVKPHVITTVGTVTTVQSEKALSCYSCLSYVYNTTWETEYDKIYKFPTSFTSNCDTKSGLESEKISTTKCNSFCVTLAESVLISAKKEVVGFVRGCYDDLFVSPLTIKPNATNACRFGTRSNLFQVNETTNNKEIYICDCDSHNKCNSDIV